MNINQYKIKIQKLVNEIDENFINLLVNKIKSTKKKGGKVLSIVGFGGGQLKKVSDNCYILKQRRQNMVQLKIFI